MSNQDNDSEFLPKYSKTQYRWVPESFLKDIFLVPHNFYAPEKEHHAHYVNDQLRYDLFYDAYNKISEFEASLLKNPEDYVKLKDIEKMEPSWFAKFYTKIIARNEEERLSSEKWIIDVNGNKESYYNVCCFQSAGDRFYTKVFPFSIYNAFWMLMQNWSF